MKKVFDQIGEVTFISIIQSNRDIDKAFSQM